MIRQAQPGIRQALRRAALASSVVLIASGLRAQLSVAPQTDLQALAQTITGNGVQILNPTITCHGEGYGSFTNSGGLLGLDAGVVLTSGRITDAIGPNNAENRTFQQGTPGSSILNAVTGRTTYDACRFEFDVIPSGDSLSFNFVFGSEEYNEWVGSQYNDVFGFFISGPGITGDPGIGNDRNIALIPSTSTAVAINNVNAGQNSAHFQHNPGGQQLQMDGFTRNLVARSPVQPCQTYHLKLIVADASDRKFDSWVFIERIQSPSITLSAVTANGGAELVEGCNPGFVRFTRDPVLPTPVTLTYYLQGSAINGVDYAVIGDPDPDMAKTIVIPAGAAHADVPITPIVDGLQEPAETLLFLLGNPYCAGAVLDSLTVPLSDSLTVAVSPDATICPGGSVPISVTGGSTYSWSPAAGLSCSDCPNPIASPTSTTAYSLTVASGACTRTVSRMVEVSDPVITGTIVQPLCHGASNGAIGLTIGGGQAPYSFAWTGPDGFTAATEDLVGIGTGDYAVTITDANGCNHTRAFCVGSPAPLSIALTPSILPFGQNIACGGESTGALSANVDGGTGPYGFAWSGPNGFSAVQQNLSGLAAGNYQLTATDAHGCSATATYMLVEPPPLTGTVASIADASCHGGNDGSASILAAGGNAPYSYAWSTSPGQDGTVADGLAAGTYTCTITDAYGCTAIAEAVIGQPLQPLQAVITGTTDALCFDAATGSAQAAATGGTAPYAFAWNTSPAQGGPSATGLLAGSYTVTVTDALGCETAAAAIVGGASAELWAYFESVTHVTCFGEADGTATLDVSGGSGSYSILWNTAPPQTGLTATGLAPGDYLVAVSDNNGCDETKYVPLTILGPAGPLAVTLAVTPISCNGAENAAVDLQMSGGLAPYTHQWSDSFGNATGIEDLTGLGPAVYYLHAFDALGCVYDTAFTLTEPPAIAVTASVSPAECSGLASGAIDAAASGGTGALSFAWSGPEGFAATTEDISALASGSYQLVATDANGCTASATYTVTQPGDIVISLTVADHNGAGVSCPDAMDGAIDATISGGTAPLTVSWSGPGGYTSADADISGLGAGTYLLTVTDSNGCRESAQIEVTAPDTLTTSITAALYNGYGTSCAGASDGVLSASVSGGIAPITFAWSGPDAFVASGATIQDLAVGGYTVTATDANGCTATASATITAPPALTATATPFFHPGGSAISCAGAADGAIDLAVLGGAPPYSIVWSNGLGYASIEEDISGLEAGGYQATVTDANGCSTSVLAVLEAPAPIGLTAILSGANGSHVSCSDATDGSINLTASGGTGPYLFDWSTGDATEDLSGIGAGAYSVQVSDANGCSATATYDLVAPDALAISLNAEQAAVTCPGAADGAIASGITGGSAPYTLLWSGPDGFAAASASIDGLGAGTYALTVTDASGCIGNAELSIAEPSGISVTITASSYNGGHAIPCAGLSNGSAVANATGGTGSHSYAWSGPDGYSSQAPSITGLASGDYSVTVTDSNGCTGAASITLQAPQPLAATPSVTDLNGYGVSCQGNDGSASVNIAGGTQPYGIAWSGPGGFTSTQASISGLAAGNYALVINDANGCQAVATITLTAPPPLEVTFSSTANNCPTGAAGLIDLTVVGGAAPYSFAWSGPGGFASAVEDITGLSNGDYTVAITDALGCTATLTAAVDSPLPLGTGAYVSFYGSYNLQCQGDSSGVIELEPVGGTAPWTVMIAGPGGFASNTPLNNGLVAGTYSVSITDGNGCQLDTLIALTEPPSQIGASLQVSNYPSGTNVSCHGASDGWIDATVSGGSGPYTFDWRGPDSLAFSSEDITGLPAGTYAYELVVIDANQCAFATEVTLTEPDSALEAGAIASAYNGYGISCPGAADGTLEALFSGGSGGYTINWSGPAGFSSDLAALAGLSPGAYTLTVTDINGCTATHDLLLSAPDAIVTELVPGLFNGGVNISCAGADDGSIVAEISGGAGSISFQWSGPGGFAASGAAIGSLAPGAYCLAATDANGCAAQQCVTLTGPEALTASTTASDASCGESTGTADLAVSGGTAPYIYAWSQGSTMQNLDGLAGGSYSVVVTDANGCTATAEALVGSTPPLVAEGTASDAICHGGTDGSITVNVTSGAAPFAYAWSHGLATSDAMGLSAGTYAIMITDSNGCTWSQAWTIEERPELIIDAVTSNYSGGYEVSTHQGQDGSIDLSVSGGAPPYAYSWSNGASGSAANALGAGIYTVTVTDANGCSAQLTIELTAPEDLIMPTGFTPNQDGFNDAFIVQGLDAHPANLLTVLNRWGNVVFEQLNYRNDWSGDSSTGDALPNGTYFVILNINNGERTLQGYVDLRR